MALPTAYYIIFYSYPFTLSLLLFPFTSNYLRPIIVNHLYTKYTIIYINVLYLFYILRPLYLFALYILVIRVFLFYYNSRLNLDSNNK
jgi:hypothetical protein